MNKVDFSCRIAAGMTLRDMEDAFVRLSACLQSWRLDVLSEDERHDIEFILKNLVVTQDSFQHRWQRYFFPDYDRK